MEKCSISQRYRYGLERYQTDPSFGFLLWTDGQFIRQKGELYIHHEDDTMMVETLKSNLKNAARIFTQRLIKYAKGKQIVVPLSGGFDSRLVLTALAEARYPHLLAFTYGRHHSGEVKMSEKISESTQCVMAFCTIHPTKVEILATKS